MLASIQSMLETAFPEAIIQIHSEDDVHFDLLMVSQQFTGLTKLKQQQLVYQALGDYVISGKIHALAMKTYTPESWVALNKG